MRYGFLIMALLLAFNVSAIELAGLYEVELVAKSDAAEDREQAMKQALYAVLNRVVVSDDIAQLSIVQAMLKKPISYVKQFQYVAMTEQTFNDQNARLLKIEFDEEQILNTLQQSQIAMWDEMRPQTLIWLVVEADGQQQVYNPETYPEFEMAFNLAGKVKGLPILFPLFDLDEQQAVPISSVLNVDTAKLLAASARYEVNSVLAATITRHDDCWQGNWSLLFDGKVKQWSGLCQPLRATVLAGAQQVFQVLSNYYGARPLASH